MQRELVLTSIPIFSLALASVAAAQECPSKFPSSPSPRQVIACVGEMKREISQLRAQLKEAVASPSNQTSTSAAKLPKGAVVAFDRVDGCPPDWLPFEATAGRFIIGVDGDAYTLPYLAGKPSYQTGGSATHTLTKDEMPTHQHTVTSSPHGTNIHDGFGGSDADYGIRPTYDPTVLPTPNWATTQHTSFMANEGDGEAHNNMPPFIALYYCKHELGEE